MPIDPDRIFSLFGDNSGKWDKKGHNYKNPTTLPTIDQNHPNYFVGMFTKLILNHLNYTEELIRTFKKADPTLDIKQIEQAGEIMLYGRAWFYIENIDITDPYHVEVLLKDKDDTLLACQLTLKYFEEIEEYEKCAFLKKIIDLLLK